jgi:2-oxoglutarate ferredoxin oxidoreductase subunit gamma
MKQEIVVAGFGGQGVMLAGKVLTHAGMLEGKNVTYFPSYGAEVRGGTANSTTIISQEEIPSPISAHPDILLAMNSPSCRKFGPRLKKKGTLIANTTIIDSVFKRGDLTIIEIPATSLAHKLGSNRSANMIMLGAYLKCGAFVSLKSVEKSLTIFFQDKKEFLDINRKALRIGMELVSEKLKTKS